MKLLRSNFSKSRIENWIFRVNKAIVGLVLVWFGFCGIGAATDRTSPDIFHYRNLKLPHCETIARQFDWLFSCAVLFTSQSISNSWIKLVILYSPVQFLTPSHNLSVSTERLGERNTWLYSSAVKICFWLHFCTFSHTTSCFKQCLLAT